MTIQALDTLGHFNSRVPASQDLHAHYDATELTASGGDAISTWPDETSNGHDLTAGTAPTYAASAINGNPVVRFDGTDDFLDVAFTALSQPNHIFVVYKLNSFSTSSYEMVYDSETTSSGDDRNTFGSSNSDNWFQYAPPGGTLQEGGTLDTANHISSSLFNGTNSVSRLDGSQIISGDAGDGALNGLTVGAQYDGSNFAEVDVGEILIYPQDKSGIVTDVESYLSDKWGITV